MADQTFGLPTGGANRQRVYQYFKDTLIITPGTAINSSPLFSSADTKPLYLRNQTFPTTLGRKFTITHIRAHVNVQFAAISGPGTSAVPAQIALQDAFIMHSSLQITIENKAQSIIPLGDLATMEVNSTFSAVSGATSRGAYSDRTSRYFALREQDYIEIPENGNISVDFLAAPGYTALNGDFTSGQLNLTYLPGAGVSFRDTASTPNTIQNFAYSIQFVLYGQMDRPVA